MIRRLMKLDLAWVWLPFVGIAAVLIGALGGNFAFWNLLLVAGVIAADRQPDNQFHAGLPVRVRPVLVARTLSVLALIWVPLLLAGFLLTANRDLGMKAGAIVALGSLITFVSVWIQTTRIQGRTGPPWFALIPLGIWIAYGFGLPVLSDAFWRWGGWLFQEGARAAAPTAVICLFLSGAVFLRAFVMAPESFPVESAKVQSRVTSGASRRHPLVRIALSLSYLWVLFFLVAVPVGLRIGDSAVMASIVLVTSWSVIRPKLRWMSFLPVSPSAVLAVILLPALVAAAGGYEVGLHVPIARLSWLKLADAPGITLQATPGCGRQNVVPPLEFLLPAITGKAPLIQAPWGETFRPAAQRMDGVEVYNPWAVGCDNSERFLDWQFNRASVAIYGKPIPRNQLAGAQSVLTPLAVPALRARIFSVISLAVGLMLITLVSMCGDWYRLQLVTGRILLQVVATMLCAVPIVSQSFLARWASWSLPGSLPVATAIAIIPIALIYWAMDAMFRRLEFVDKPAAGDRP